MCVCVCVCAKMGVELGARADVEIGAVREDEKM